MKKSNESDIIKAIIHLEDAYNILSSNESIRNDLIGMLNEIDMIIEDLESIVNDEE